MIQKNDITQKGRKTLPHKAKNQLRHQNLLRFPSSQKSLHSLLLFEMIAMLNTRFNASVQKNNSAVHCIRQGNISHAHGLLTGAISSMRTKLDDISSSSDNLSQTSFEDVGLQSLPVFHESQHHQALDEQSFDCSAICFFDRVFLIEREDTDNERLVCAVVLYNFAIVFHLASCGGKRSHRHLEKVLKLYKMSAMAVERYKSRSAEAYLLTLAIRNNMAHIHSVYFNSRETHQALDEMLLMLKSENSRKTVDSSNAFVFQLNAFVHSHSQSVRFAPSA
jgi:hypothetical protein